MADSKYWRSIAALMVVGIFYLAHGLHNSSSMGSLPSLTQEVQAGDVSIISKPNNSNVKIVTTSEQGNILYVWTATTTSNIGVPKYVGRVQAK